MPVLNLTIVALLLVATAFFVATEFAMVKLRPSRIHQLVLEGRKNALAVQRVSSNLDGYLSACQLGITMTALGLGTLGESTIHALFAPVFIFLNLSPEITQWVAIVLSLSLMTFLHVVVGELAPKTLAIQKAEQICLLFAPTLIIFYKILYPFIWILNGSANFLIRLFGLKPVKEHDEAHSEEELKIILNESYESGKINQSELGYVNRIFEFDDLLAREIMVPRTDMICLSVNATLQENLRVIKEEQYTRFPVIEEDKDHIVGVVNTKQFFLEHEDNPNLDLEELIHPVFTASESIPIKTLLKQMQKHQSQLALLIDEYGGTSGMVTIEDILEEIVGEIRDEFDTEERRDIEQVGEVHYIVDGKVSLGMLSDLLHTELEHEEIDTIGGWLYSQNNVLKTGDTARYKGFEFTILEKTKHRIRKVEIKKMK